MPPKSRKATKSEESVAGSAGQDSQLTGVFANDFPIICTQNGLPPILVRSLDDPPDTSPVTSQYWVWCKAELSDDPAIKKLSKFAIRSLKVTAPVMTALQCSFQSTHVSEISFWQTDIDMTNLASLVDLVPQVQCRTLDVSGSCLNDLSPFKKVLTNPEYKNLVNLSLRCCELTDDLLVPIGEALKENIALQQLDLGHNKLGDECAKLLANSLRMNRNLLSLSLSGNRITDIGAVHLATIFKEFVLNYEEIIKRRRIFSEALQDQWSAFNDSLSRKNSSRKSISREKQPAESGKKPGALAMMKAASFIAKTKKGADQRKKTGKSGDEKTGPTTPVHAATKPLSQPTQGPFIEGISTNESGQIVCMGNYSIINLSLSYNAIGTTGLNWLLSAIQYQRQNSSTSGIGLQSVSLQGNLFPNTYDKYADLQDLLTSKSSLEVSTSATTCNDELKP